MVLSLIKTCPAKINLFLEVKNKRKDGYHNIESLMTFCNYGDSLSVKKSKKFVFRVNGPFSKELFGKYNLIEEAKNKLEFLYKREFKVDVLLTKNLPIASGMAGGSSNATTFIRCIKEIFNLKDVSGFDNLLLSLGADVPFCYYGKTALVSGIGEKLKFVSIKENLNSSEIVGKMMMGILGSVNEFEVNLLGERISDVKQSKKVKMEVYNGKHCFGVYKRGKKLIKNVSEVKILKIMPYSLLLDPDPTIF